MEETPNMILQCKGKTGKWSMVVQLPRHGAAGIVANAEVQGHLAIRTIVTVLLQQFATPDAAAMLVRVQSLIKGLYLCLCYLFIHV